MPESLVRRVGCQFQAVRPADQQKLARFVASLARLEARERRYLRGAEVPSSRGPNSRRDYRVPVRRQQDLIVWIRKPQPQPAPDGEAPDAIAWVRRSRSAEPVDPRTTPSGTALAATHPAASREPLATDETFDPVGPLKVFDISIGGCCLEWPTEVVPAAGTQIDLQLVGGDLRLDVRVSIVHVTVGKPGA